MFDKKPSFGRPKELPREVPGTGAFGEGVVFSILCACTSGLNPIFAKLGYGAGLSGMEILHSRFIFAAFLLAAAGSFLQKGFWHFSWRLLAKTLFMAGAILVPLNLCYVFALEDIPASMMGLISYAYPLVVLLVNGLLLRHGFHRRQVLSVAFILLGCAFIFSDAFALSLPRSALALAFLATVMFSAIFIALQQLASNESALQVAFLNVALTAGILCVNHHPDFLFGLTGTQLAITGCYGLMSTFLSTVFMARAVQILGATEAGIFTSLELVFTIVFAMLLLGEQIPVFRWCGMAMLLIGLLIPNAGVLRTSFRRNFSLGRSIQH